MGFVSSAQIRQFVQQPPDDLSLIVLYGKDTGLMGEVAERIGEQFSSRYTQSAERYKHDLIDQSFDEAALDRDLYSVSMFSPASIVQVRLLAGRKGALNATAQRFIELNVADTLLMIIAGDVPKSAMLVKLAGNWKNGAAIGCYPDNQRNLGDLIDEITQAYSCTITREARQWLIHQLGKDRLLSRRELERLCLFAGNGETIDLAMASDVLDDQSAVDFYQVLDLALLGEGNASLHRLSTLARTGFDASAGLALLIKGLDQLIERLTHAREAGKSPALMVKSLGFAVHYSRREALVKILTRWEERGARYAQTQALLAQLQSRLFPDLAMSTLERQLHELADRQA